MKSDDKERKKRWGKTNTSKKDFSSRVDRDNGTSRIEMASGWAVEIDIGENMVSV